MVQVRAAGPSHEGSFGTGYLVGPRLVMTAGHLLARAGDPSLVQVCRPDADPRGHEGVVRWARADEKVDAALIEVTSATWETPASWSGDGRTRRFGKLVTTLAGRRVTARGFPRLQKAAADRFDEQLDGEISPGTGALAGRYEITSSRPLPAAAADGGSGWAGMSGAAIFDGDLLLGVITRDRRAATGTRLAATRIRDVLDIPEARTILGDGCGRVPVAEPAELDGILSSAAVARELSSPAMLLRAEAEAVSFRGREREQQSLLSWCLGGDQGLSVRVLTGPGGQGKTRLARWMIAAVRESGWSSGELSADIADDRPGRDASLGLLARMTEPVLVVVDYAESRPQQVRQLIERIRSTAGRVRILLVARSWQADPLGATAMVHEILARASQTALELGPLDATASGRAEAYRAAALDLSRLLGRVEGHRGTDWPSLVPRLDIPDQLGASRYDTALSVQMAALVELLQLGPAPVPASAGEPVEAILLRHEERYWRRTAAARRLGVAPDLLGRAVAAACLCGARDEDQAAGTLGRLRHFPKDETFAAALWLRRLYPAPPGRYWGSLQPDRVAEFHASVTVLGAEGLLGSVLTGAAADQQTQAMTVLARAAVGHANAGRAGTSTELLRTLDAARQLVGPRVTVLQASHFALPATSEVLGDFAVRLAEDVAALYRQLAAGNPAAYQADLADALTKLAGRYGHAGQRDRAVAAAEEAAAIYRRLVAGAPQAHGSGLAQALNNLAVSYRTKGRDQEAVAVIEKAVGIWRRLAQASPAAYDSGLAKGLSNLAVSYQVTGQRAKSVAASEEATGLYRALAAADPDAYEPALARSLMDLSRSYKESGRHDEALAPADEAVRLFRELAATNPDSYTPDLALALTSLANLNGRVG